MRATLAALACICLLTSTARGQGTDAGVAATDGGTLATSADSGALATLTDSGALATPTDSGALAPTRAIARLVGPDPSYVGQLVQVEVELLRDNRARDKPAAFFPELHVSGAVSLLSESAPPPETRQAQGVEWLVQKRRYLIFPQREGHLKVPPIAVDVPGPDGAPARVTTAALSLEADVPRGAGSQVPLVARDVRIERSVEGDLGALRVGDSFSVHVQLRATDTDAVMLPVLAPPELEGLSRYPAQASSDSHTNRGAYRAERVDSATYVAREWGFYTLPRVSVLWLDPQTGHYAEAVAPALSFRARVNPQLGVGCVGGPEAVVRKGSVLLGLVLLGLMLWRAGRRVRAARARRARVPRSTGERAAFAAVQKAAKAGQDGATLTALYRWLRFSVQGLPTLARLREDSGDPAIGSTTLALEDRVSAASHEGQAADLLAPLGRYRRSAKDAGPAADDLPKLND